MPAGCCSSLESGSRWPPDLTRVAQFGGTTLRLVREVELARDPAWPLGPDILAPTSIWWPAARLRASPDQVGLPCSTRGSSAESATSSSPKPASKRGDPWSPAASLANGPEDEAATLLETARRQMLAAVETGKRPGRIYKMTGRPCPAAAPPGSAPEARRR